jgi:hypothetical protein
MLNRISKTLTVKEKEEYYQCMDALNALFNFFIALSSGEKKKLYKMGAVHIGYVKNIYSAIKSNPDWLPPVFNLEEYAKDVQLLSDLNEMHTRIKTLYDRFESTMLQLGHESMRQSDEIFSNLKRIAKKSTDPSLDFTIKQITDKLEQEIKNSHAGKG